MSRLTKLVATITVLGGLSVLNAQPAPPAADPPAASATVEVKASTSIQISVAEMRAQIPKVQMQIETDVEKMMVVKEQAKKQKDIIKLSCVNDKMVQVKAEHNIADDATLQLNAALDNNSDDRNMHYANLQKSAGSIHKLYEESLVCLGEPDLYKQESGNKTDAPIFPDDPDENPMGPDIAEPPAYASPFT